MLTLRKDQHRGKTHKFSWRCQRGLLEINSVCINKPWLSNRAIFIYSICFTATLLSKNVFILILMGGNSAQIG